MRTLELWCGSPAPPFNEEDGRDCGDYHDLQGGKLLSLRRWGGENVPHHSRCLDHMDWSACHYTCAIHCTSASSCGCCAVLFLCILSKNVHHCHCCRHSSSLVDSPL